MRSIHWDEIDGLVKAARKVDPLSSSDHLRHSLEQWWCLKYTRPFKDPLLKEYTTNELIYEFLTHYYQDPANDPDKVKEAKATQTDDDKWALEQVQEMEKRAKAKEAEVIAALPEDVKKVLEEAEEISTDFDT